MGKMTKKELDDLVRISESTTIPNWNVYTPHRVFVEAWQHKDETTETMYYSGSIRFMLDEIRSITIRTECASEDARWTLRQTAISIGKAFENIAIIGMVYDTNGAILMQCNLDEVFIEYDAAHKPPVTVDSFPPMTNTTVH